MRVGLYCQAAFGVSSLAVAKPLHSNRTEYPSNRPARHISLNQNIVETRRLAFLTHANKLEFQHASHASSELLHANSD